MGRLWVVVCWSGLVAGWFLLLLADVGGCLLGVGLVGFGCCLLFLAVVGWLALAAFGCCWLLIGWRLLVLVACGCFWLVGLV